VPPPVFGWVGNEGRCLARLVTIGFARHSLPGGGFMGAPSAIDSLLMAARRDLDRVQPADLADEMASGALVVDIRPWEQRQRDGDLPGAIVVDRNVLEWRLDPSCPHHLPDVKAADRRIIIVCNEGYSSSLAAATLRQLGMRRATDLVGGFQAYMSALLRAEGGSIR
jgi:rhodanese-related sulfurtransferase